ncbi:MAG: aldo/keto reductase [archaeon]|nr:MAG: aldo/keto reductase [archaeon]
MEYRRLGKTNEKLSVIGMGTWRIGVFSSPEEKAKQTAAIRRGLDLGMNLIDTAEMYAGGRSEETVGEAIRERRDDAFIATKVSPENLSRTSVISSCNSSLKRLGTDHIDLYQVHWPNPSIPIEETMRAMEELVDQGKVRYIGVSNFSVPQTEEAKSALRKNELASNQVEYSLVSRGVERDILPYCERERISLIAYTPLARGSIPSSRFPAPIRERYGMTPAQMMLNWVTRSERVLAIPKTARADHMEENANSVSVRFTQEEYLSMAN